MDKPASEPRDLALSPAALLSQFLATVHGEIQATTSQPLTLGAAAHDQRMRTPCRAVRILLNNNGCSCFLKSFFQGLSWQALKCDALSAQHWTNGLEIIDLVTRPTPLPWDLCAEAAMIQLFEMGWPPSAMNHQQDILEFADVLLPILKPTFVSGQWAPLPSIVDGTLGETHLSSEKGLTHTVLRLPIAQTDEHELDLQFLIQQWHDPQGLCRLLLQDGPGLCLAIDRSSDELCEIHDAVMVRDVHSIPCFDSQTQGGIHRSFQVVALAFHVGSSPTSGHYRTAIRTDVDWKLYDDGTIPLSTPTLPHEIFRQVVLLWLVRTQTDETPGSDHCMAESADAA